MSNWCQERCFPPIAKVFKFHTQALTEAEEKCKEQQTQLKSLQESHRGLTAQLRQQITMVKLEIFLSKRGESEYISFLLDGTQGSSNFGMGGET